MSIVQTMMCVCDICGHREEATFAGGRHDIPAEWKRIGDGSTVHICPDCYTKFMRLKHETAQRKEATCDESSQM